LVSTARLTGKIYSVTIQLQDMKKADHQEAEQARKSAALKKGLSG
jgi:hypothetical protein